jgi:hypothetical protein
LQSNKFPKRISHRFLTKELGLPVYRTARNGGIPYLFIDETPVQYRKQLQEFMAHQTCPLVDEQRWAIYPWDYQSFLRYKKPDNIPVEVWD